jgi:hypothetical protein
MESISSGIPVNGEIAVSTVDFDQFGSPRCCKIQLQSALWLSSLCEKEQTFALPLQKAMQLHFRNHEPSSAIRRLALFCLRH